MKCPYCGGEVSSQSLKCTFCGRENEEGIRFWQELQEKSERNRLLRPFLLKQKKPELAQKMLTRVILIFTIANILMLAISFCIYYVAEQEEVRTPEPGSIAESFYQEYLGNTDYFSMSFFREQNEYIDMLEAGEMPGENAVSLLVSDAYRVVRELDDEDEETAEKIRENMRAFFSGYIGLTEDEMVFLEPDWNGEYAYSMNGELKQKTIALILERQKEVLP